MEKVRITQIKSTIDRSKKQKLTMQSLGLKRINHSIVKELNPQVKGMIDKVAHLLKIEEEK